MALTSDVKRTLSNLKFAGIRFNIVNEVESDIGDDKVVRRIELHYYYERLDGRERGHFVAELDLYGNMTSFGPYLKSPKQIIRQYDADGEEIK